MEIFAKCINRKQFIIGYGMLLAVIYSIAGLVENIGFNMEIYEYVIFYLLLLVLVFLLTKWRANDIGMSSKLAIWMFVLQFIPLVSLYPLIKLSFSKGISSQQNLK